nr:copia protein [Tanacetum cinerariifolium]
MKIIGTTRVYMNKLDENGVVSRNKARLVAQSYNQQEGIDYDETYAPVARLESIRILLAYACAIDFKLFQMDVKSAFLNGLSMRSKMTTLAEHIIVAGAENPPPMLEKSMYDSWASHIRLFIKGNKNVRMMLDSIDNGLLVYPTIEENGQTRPKKYSKLTKARQPQDNYNVQATNIILHSLPPDLLYNLFDKFAYVQESSSQYHDLNALPPEWSKFVTDVKLAKNLYTTNYDQLYAYLIQHERHANESPQHLGSSMYPPPQQFTPVYATPIHHQHHYTLVNPQQQSVYPQPFISPLVTQQSQAEFPQLDYCLDVRTFRQGKYPIECINKAMAFQSVVASRPQSFAWFKEKLMLAEAQEAAFQTKYLDAYDSHCDVISSAKVVLMKNLSSCDHDVLSEVPYFDTYLNDMINQDVQEMSYSKQTHIVDFLNNEITSYKNIISYSQYLQESQNAGIQDNNSFARIVLLVLSLVEQMTNHVANLDNENQTNKMVNESLTTELERYKGRVAIFEQR